MKKLSFLVFILLFVIYICTDQNATAMPNPWINCNDDISCGAKQAGFNLPLKVDNYSVRAMKGLLEIAFPLDKKRTVIVRKAEAYNGTDDNNGIKDISGDYNNHPLNKAIKLPNGIYFNVRGDKKKFYVANFAAETGYYSFYCEKGMNIKDLEYLYKILEEAEAPRLNDNETNYTIEQLQDIRRVDGIVETIYTQDCFPRKLQKMGVTKECFERANLGQDSFCSLSEIRMIKDYYKKNKHKNSQCDENEPFCATDY